MEKQNKTIVDGVFAVKKSKKINISKKAENELFKNYHENNDFEAKESLVNANLGLIHIVANNIARNKDEAKEFVQEGFLALQKAIDNFDYKRKVRFSTYAFACIEHEIKKYILNQNKYIKLTKKDKSNLEKWIDAKEHFANLGVEIIPEGEMVEYLRKDGLDLKDIRQIEYKFYSIFPNESEIDEFESMHSLDSTDLLFKDEMIHQANNEILQAAIDKLSEKERDVINKKFGLKGERPHTLQEIADIYEVSRERIRQIKASALFKIERQIVNKI